MRAPARPRGRTRSSPTKKADLVARARVQREWSSQGVRNAMKKSPDNDKIRRKAARTESSEKQAQKVRQMESRIAQLDEVEEPRKEWGLQFTHRGRAAVELGGRDAERRGGAPGRVRARPGDPAGRRGGPDRRHRAERRRQDDPAAAAARPAGTSTRARRVSGAAVAIGEMDQARTVLAGDLSALGDAFEAEVPDVTHRRGAHAAGEVRAARPITSPVRWARCRPASAPAPRWRCCRRRGVNVLVLDEPTNHLDLPAIEQLEEALAGYGARCCWCRTTAGCSRPCELTRRWHVEGGTVREA